MIVVIQDYPCGVCQYLTPHIYMDKEQMLVCIRCKSEGRHTKVKLVDPVVVIGKIQN